MQESSRKISVLVDVSGDVRGDTTARESIPVSKLAAEVQGFVEDIGHILDKAAKAVVGPARLSEVDVSASIEVSGKLSLLGTGVETKGQAGISFKFIIPTASA